MRIAAALTVAAALWFSFAPGDAQMLGIRVLTPALAAMTAAGQWRIGADRRLPAASARFWLVLSLALFIFTAGMVVDFAATTLDLVLRESRPMAGETLLYPIGSLFAIVALVVYPTSVRRRMERVKIGFDIAIVLFGSATFVWYFLGSERWMPGQGIQRLTDSLVLPALTLVAGFAVLRITLAGVNVISRQTMYCFVFAASTAAASIFMDVTPEGAVGRIGSMLQVLALAACVLGVSIQRRVTPSRSTQNQAAARPGWRRPFTVLPYVALVATVGLLLRSIAAHLDYREWVVAVGVLALCAAVIARQLTSLWENSRLLASNRQLTVKLEHHAYHDDLTGLANRAFFVERIQQSLARPRGGRLIRQHGSSLAVLFVDLDDFKIVNDTLGHHIGDELLVAVAGRLRDAIGASETLGRLGGDEFAILLDDAAEGDAIEVARAVVAALRGPFWASGVQVRVQASVGIAMATRGVGPTTAVELLRNADVAMYSAKSAGQKGSWRVFEAPMLAGLMHRHELRAGLVTAVERDEFEVHYQPITDLATGQFVGAEALARWRQGGDLVLPDEFVPLAEEAGLIADIDRYVLVRACEQATRWQTQMEPGTMFALHVNVSARQLARPELVTDIEQALRVSGLPARSLTLEISESGLTHEPQAVAERLRGLTRLGVHVAIDDFGAGHSSLANLRAVPADTLKIDKAFTAELLDETVATPLAQAVIVLAATLGMNTVAEGIEHPEQARRLLALGCRRGQGFHFGRPLPASHLTALLATPSPSPASPSPAATTSSSI